MKNPKKLDISKLALSKTAKKCLRDVPNEEIIRKAYYGTLTDLKGVGASVSEEISEALKAAGFIPKNYKEIRGMLRLHAVVTGNEEVCIDEMHPEIVELFNTILTSEEAFILERLYGLDGEEPNTMWEVGKRCGLFKERVIQISTEALCKLRRQSSDLIPDCERMSLDSPISNLYLSVRPYNALKRAGCCCIAEVIWKGSDSLKKIRYMGPQSYEEMIKKLHASGFKLVDECDEEDISLDSPISSLGLSTRPHNALKKAGYRYIADITRDTTRWLKRTENIGPRSYEEIIEKLHENGFKMLDE